MLRSAEYPVKVAGLLKVKARLPDTGKKYLVMYRGA
jgi:hypothetical protein